MSWHTSKVICIFRKLQWQFAYCISLDIGKNKIYRWPLLRFYIMVFHLKSPRFQHYTSGLPFTECI